MALPIRSHGYQSPVWKLFGQEKPNECPECKKDHSLRYVGTDKKYSLAMSAKLYTCSDCGAWLDLVWARNGLTSLSSPYSQPSSRRTITVKVVSAV